MGPRSSFGRPTIAAGRQSGILVRDATVWPETGVASVAGRLIEETIVDPRLLEGYRRRQRWRRLPVIPFPGIVTCLNVGSSHANFFHSWFEALPRAWVLNGLENFRERPTVVVTQQMNPAFERMLVRLLPGGCRVVRVPRAVRLRPLGGYLHLSVPFRSAQIEGSAGPAKRLPQEYLTEFVRLATDEFGLDPSSSETTALGESGGAGCKIYVSRRRALGRKLTNDLELSEALGKLGFVTVILEDLPIPDQARLFRNATVLVAQHGAALTNLLYCQPGAHVIELFNGPSGGAKQLYRSIAGDVGLVYEALLLDGKDKDAPATVHIERLISLLQELTGGGGAG